MNHIINIDLVDTTSSTPTLSFTWTLSHHHQGIINIIFFIIVTKVASLYHHHQHWPRHQRWPCHPHQPCHLRRHCHSGHHYHIGVIVFVIIISIVASLYHHRLVLTKWTPFMLQMLLTWTPTSVFCCHHLTFHLCSSSLSFLNIIVHCHPHLLCCIPIIKVLHQEMTTRCPRY